ncbi:hypothetical protein Tco_0686558 [Tanacetum coccineum]
MGLSQNQYECAQSKNNTLLGLQKACLRVLPLDRPLRIGHCVQKNEKLSSNSFIRHDERHPVDLMAEVKHGLNRKREFQTIAAMAEAGSKGVRYSAKESAQILSEAATQ